MSDLTVIRSQVEALLRAAGGMSQDGSFKRGLRHGRMNACRDVLRLIDSFEVKLDEIQTAPARTTDPATSHEPPRKLTSKNACGKLAAAFYDCANVDHDLQFTETQLEGMTVSEAIEEADLGHLRCPWKRVSDLKYAKIIEPTGYTTKDPETGMDQEHLRITDHGRREVERLGLA